MASHVIIPMLHLSNKRKEKKKKRNINNDLAILPSHDIYCDSYMHRIDNCSLREKSRVGVSFLEAIVYLFLRVAISEQ